jgi:hypothetical protein
MHTRAMRLLRMTFAYCLQRDELDALARNVALGCFSKEEQELIGRVTRTPDLLELSDHLFRRYRVCGGIPEKLRPVLGENQWKALELHFTFWMILSRLKYDLYQRMRVLPRKRIGLDA